MKIDVSIPQPDCACNLCKCARMLGMSFPLEMESPDEEIIAAPDTPEEVG